MPHAPLQLEFPFYSLDFVDRATLSVCEVAEKLGCSQRHVHDLIDEGAIGCINLSPGGQRTFRRIPVESYRDFILRNFSGELRAKFLRTLPLAVIDEIYNDCVQIRRDKEWLRK